MRPGVRQRMDFCAKVRKKAVDVNADAKLAIGRLLTVQQLDIDRLDDLFIHYAGSDHKMDRDE